MVMNKINEAVEMVGYDNLPLLNPEDLELKVQAVAPVSYVNEVERVKAWRDRFFKAMEEKKKVANKILDSDDRFAHMTPEEKKLNESLSQCRATLQEDGENAIIDIILEIYKDQTIPYLYSSDEQADKKWDELENGNAQESVEKGLYGYVRFMPSVLKGWHVAEKKKLDSLYDDVEEREHIREYVDEVIHRYYKNVLADSEGLDESYSPRKAVDDFLTKLATVNFDNFEQLAYDLLSNMTYEQIAKFAKDYDYEVTGVQQYLDEGVQSADGWSDEIQDLDSWEVLENIHDLKYELESLVRGNYTGADTAEDLSDYIEGLAEDLKEFARDVRFLGDSPEEEEDEEDEDLDESLQSKSSEKSLKEAAVVRMTFKDYKPWGPAEILMKHVEEEGKQRQLEDLIEEMYPDGIDEQRLNELPIVCK